MTNIFGTHDENTLSQLADVGTRAARTALMADGHMGYIMPIGGVAGYRDMVSVAGVGFDIACGNCAIRTDTKLEDLGKSANKLDFMLNRLADDIASHVSFGVGRSNKATDAPTDHALFDSDAWAVLRDRAGHGLARQLKDKARAQLGTVGSGNHYVDVFADEQGYLWVGVHFGSRGLGHGIASGFMAISQGDVWGDRVKGGCIFQSYPLTTERSMEYDITDYSFYLDVERDEQVRKALEDERNMQAAESLLLEMEVLTMLEII